MFLTSKKKVIFQDQKSIGDNLNLELFPYVSMKLQ